MALLVTHSTEAYEFGGGIVYYAPWDGENPPEEADYLDAGNAPAFGFTVAVTNVEHKSSRGGQLVTDKQIVKEKGYTCALTLDEPTQAILAMFVKGTVSGNYIYALENPNQEYALRFVSDNDAGENHIVDFWRCSMDPNGNFNEVSLENFKEMQFNVTGLDDSTNHPTNAWFRITKVNPTT